MNLLSSAGQSSLVISSGPPRPSRPFSFSSLLVHFCRQRCQSLTRSQSISVPCRRFPFPICGAVIVDPATVSNNQRMITPSLSFLGQSSLVISDGPSRPIRSLFLAFTLRRSLSLLLPMSLMFIVKFIVSSDVVSLIYVSVIAKAATEEADNC